MNKELEKLRKASADIKDKRLTKDLQRFKLLTMAAPSKPEYWFNLSKVLFKLNKNQDAFKALSNAKKLGSTEAFELILKIVSDYESKSPQESKKIKNLLLGEGGEHV